MGLWPFFSYFGGKWRAAPRYPAPAFGTIVEPFAGAAGYATRHHTRDVLLIERDPVLADLWRYLIAATPAQIQALPLLDMWESVDDYELEPGARSLIGFWLNKGTTGPCKTPGAWMRNGVRPKSFWGPEIRDRIAAQVAQISHWRLIEGSYVDAPDVEATWFIDPPYQAAGTAYRHSSRAIDFPGLGAWCKTRPGQVLVCENDGADWLPFAPFLDIKGTQGAKRAGRSMEALWTRDQWEIAR